MWLEGNLLQWNLCASKIDHQKPSENSNCIQLLKVISLLYFYPLSQTVALYYATQEAICNHLYKEDKGISKVLWRLNPNQKKS